ncbi:hypothetical protein AJ80_09903 [Polytolypa hystricis UAMH7299]|uniref:Nitrate reductase n=1 Tax=Polytolypa hystricis (strain UAMH7299) TaxID=1447883 RepID=A0A2B7WH50_POLH7|nr:hypothetical protein AJ80_09903 [Polytolypa hystricis UAMH7299]
MATITQLETAESTIPTSRKTLLPLISEQPGDNDADPSHNYNIPLPPSSKRPTEVLDIDKETPDNHVSRDPRLIRLTGVHPFNVEAPLTALYNEGFLTSPELFYVRNHGYVPEVRDEDIPDWELSIEGLVEHPVVLNFKQILSEFEQITVPITLVCAGNRRKEQNQVRKSKGFSWGAAGVSTALFTGPLMSDILKKAKPMRKAKYVCMEGADKLPNGHYGTSLRLNWVMDPNRGIMLAHKMNGEPLAPDHGRPLRAVVPGQIGGRSVKWLKKLIVTDAPSDNWYHVYDNRVLPTMVSPEMSSNDPKWWYDERYAIYDLNVNSATAYPQHEEEIQISTTPSYNVRGYAYAGGGRRVTRVEISLDKGRTWRLANIEYAEDKYRDAEHGLFGGRIDMSWRETCFCWCFWSLDIPSPDLEASDAILVRAMDEAMSLQPREMYWSVLGMMNNPWFRVAIIKKDDVLKFEHPTQPALMPGGWMERVKKAGGDLQNGNWGEAVEGEENPTPAKEVPQIVMTNPNVKRTITLDEFKSHKAADEPWFVVEGEVYDGTPFLEGHPGGAQSIISAAATDATEEFMAIHSETAKAMMVDYHIGTLDGAAKQALSNGNQAEGASLSPTRDVFLDSRTWATATLTKKVDVSPDTRIFTFKLSHDAQTLGLPIGQHVMMKIPDPAVTSITKSKQSLIRSYTPISETTTPGRIDILIKVYQPTTTNPIGGKMTMALDALPLNSPVEFKGPTGRFEYLGKGRVALNNGAHERHIDTFYMICGGSGITPIFQVLRAVMQDQNDNQTRCVVLDGNRYEADILLRSELGVFAAQDKQKCTIVHTLSQPSETWTGRKGRISEALLSEYVVRKEQSMVIICGPGTMEDAAKKILLGKGWDEEDLHFF